MPDNITRLNEISNAYSFGNPRAFLAAFSAVFVAINNELYTAAGRAGAIAIQVVWN